MQSMKRTWQKPELAVLVRSRPEEAVLAGCKIKGIVMPGGDKCRSGAPPVDCQVITSS